MSNKPVIFLALANEREIDQRYLRQLKEERFAIEEALYKASDHCEVVVVPDATVEDIFRIFNDDRYRNRIAVFHYAGHADGESLHMESREGGNSSAHREGLAAFLGQQQGLKLVFFNGCATAAHVGSLIASGIPNIVYTVRKIQDAAAVDFARRFYTSVSNDRKISEAISVAEAEIRTRTGDSFRSLYWEDSEPDEKPPWRAEIQSDWRLSDLSGKAAGGPLKAFIVYAAEDELHKNKLGKHLTMLKRRKILDTWDSGDLKAGADIKEGIMQKLKQSGIVLLLVSADYLGSDACFEIEEAVMEQHRLRNTRVIPVLLKECDYDGLPFSKFQALPRNAKPILGRHWNSEDEALNLVARDIRTLCESLRS